MSAKEKLPVTALGQTGFKFEMGWGSLFIDPYLSDYVEKKEGKRLRRMVPALLDPRDIRDASVVLITHEHIDHCDPETLVPIAEASTTCRFYGPRTVVRNLIDWGIDSSRVFQVGGNWLPLAGDCRIRAVPAAHPWVEDDGEGGWRCIGYLIEFRGRRIYHSGDTSLDSEIISNLTNAGPIDVAFISVNERNYYRDRMGVIGNMSVRDAFMFAGDIGARLVVPMHWDMFECNSVYREEIELLYRKMNMEFCMEINPTSI